MRRSVIELPLVVMESSVLPTFDVSGSRADSIVTGPENRSIGFDETPRATFGVESASGVRVVANVVRKAGAHNQIGTGLVRLIGDVVSVRYPGGPASHVTRVQYMRPIVLRDCHFPRENVEELIFPLVPVSIRGTCARHQNLDKRPELCEAADIGHALSFRSAKRITGLACNLGLSFSNDHLSSRKNFLRGHCSDLIAACLALPPNVGAQPPQGGRLERVVRPRSAAVVHCSKVARQRTSRCLRHRTCVLSPTP